MVAAEGSEKHTGRKGRRSRHRSDLESLQLVFLDCKQPLNLPEVQELYLRCDG